MLRIILSIFISLLALNCSAKDENSGLTCVVGKKTNITVILRKDGEHNPRVYETLTLTLDGKWITGWKIDKGGAWQIPIVCHNLMKEKLGEDETKVIAAIKTRK